MCTYLKNMEGYKLNDLKLKDFDSIQEMFDRAFKRVNTFEDFRTELVEGKEKRAGTELIQENTKKQKVEDDKETTELKQLMKIIPDEEEVAIDAIPLAVKEDLEDLYKLVKAKFESTKPVEDLDLLLWGRMLKTLVWNLTLIEDAVWWINSMKCEIGVVWTLWSTFLEDATYADLHVGREEVSPCTTYTFNDVGKEA
ncbi:hypothetical protein Tco_1105631 [Tanacetum coccineum]